MGGPSSEAKANEQAQTDFYKATVAQQEQTFSAQKELLDQIKAITLPILSAGPQQYGFTPEEDSLLRSQITEGGAKSLSDTVNATRLRELQQSNGASLLPTGASLQAEESARILSEQQTSQALTNEKLAGYAQGNQLYTQALSALSGVAQMQSPTTFSSAATGAGSNATGAVNLADSERSSILSSILGGVISGGTALATGGASKLLSITPYSPGATGK